jgi:hypothetical protein
MSKILKRPMFRKGGYADISANGGVMKIANPRSNFDGGGAAKRYEENLKLLQQAAGPAGDSKQDLYDMLISGGLNLVSGEGAGKGTLGAIAQSFKKPAEQFLAARPGEEQFQRQVRMAAAQGAITQQQAEEILQKELESKEKISKMAIEAQTGNLTNIIAEEQRKEGKDPVLANNIARYVTTIKPELDKKYGSSLVGGRIEVDTTIPSIRKKFIKDNKNKKGQYFYDAVYDQVVQLVINPVTGELDLADPNKAPEESEIKKKTSYAETISEAMKKQREENRKKRIEEDYKYGIEIPGLN